nr:MAG TPA: hypothetical protein [Bacteriophage sp.]
MIVEPRSFISLNNILHHPYLQRWHYSNCFPHLQEYTSILYISQDHLSSPENNIHS